MRNQVIRMLVLLSAIGASKLVTASDDTLELSKGRTVEIIDVIDGSALGIAQKINKLASENTEGIDVFINSPGGSVLMGYFIVDAVRSAQAKGIIVRCAVGVLAASMAFNLLMTCDERYALAHAALLFHPARIQTRQALTTVELLRAYEDLKRIEDSTNPEIRQVLGFDSATYERHYRAETLWQADQLVAAAPNAFLKIVKDITGTSSLFNPERPRGLEALFGRAQAPAALRPYEIVHISPYNKG